MNFQNVPRSLKEVKAGFVPKQDAFMFFDYSNIELRILGYYLATTLDDWSIADEFTGGEDLHRNTAVGIFNLPPADITEELRQKAKVLNFSVVYGGGVPTLIRQGIVSNYMDGKKLLDNFHATRPGIKILRKRVIQRIDDVGYITTPWGSRLHPLEDHKALNVLIQGCAADLMRHGIREVSRYCREQHLASHIVNVVHDEIMMDCVRGELLRLHENIPKLMNYEPLNDVVPIRTSVEISYTNWAEKENYDPTIIEWEVIKK